MGWRDMYNVILQPTGSKTAQFNYHSTMRIGIKLSEFKKYMKKKEFEVLSDIYKSGIVHVWGVTPGASNKREWNKIEIGDVAIFSGKGMTFFLCNYYI